MTNAELLAKIKTEIERQIKNYRDDGFGCHANSLENLLSFLSTLKAEKPMNQEGLEEEYKDYVESDPVYGKLVNRNAGLSIARHFAKWGAEHSGSSETPVDLEEAAEISFDEAKSLTEEHIDFIKNGLIENKSRPIGPHWFCEYAKNRFIAGAKWQKEQMMQEAVEGKVAERIQGKLYARFQVPKTTGVEFGDKVCIIVLPKEDKK